MNYSTNPVMDADRYLTATDTYLDDVARAESAMAAEFLAMVKKGDMSAPALFAPKTTDWTDPMGPQGQRPKRYQTTAEVMAESLDYGDGPSTADAMGLISAMAQCSVGGMCTLPINARGLIDRMAASFARHNAEVS